mgnify:FL=1
MAQEYEYGFLPQDERYLGLLGNLFSPMRRPIIEAPETTYLEADGVKYPQYSEGVYGEPEFGLQYMPAYQAVAGLLSDPVETAKAMPEAMRQAANDQILAGLDIATGGTGELVTEEGDRISYDALAVSAPLAPAGIAAARAGGSTLGAMGGKLSKAEKDPMKYSGIEMPYRIEDTPMEIQDTSGLLMPKRQINLESLQGKLLMPFFTDRSAIGGRVESVDNIKLTEPVDLEGGTGFMRGEAAQGEDALWASKQGIVSKMVNKAQRSSDEAGGADVVGVNVLMGVDAIDHSTMPTKIVSRMLPNMEIKKADKDAFDDAMKKIDEDFVGIDSKDLENYLDNSSGDLRKQFIRLMDKSTARKAGFPNIGAVRRAVTDPELYDTPTFSEGVSFGQMDINNPIIENPKFPHTTYSGQIRGYAPDQRGGYIGGLLGDFAPQGTFFPESFGALSSQIDKAGNPLTPQNIKYAQERQLPTQMVDQQMLDILMQNSLLGR